MSTVCLSSARLSVAAIVLLALLAVAGCGADAGPSNNKVRLDLFDRMNTAFHGLLTPGEFSITDRQVLSEDRIKYHVIVSYRLDPQKAAAAERSSRLIGYINDTLHKARRYDGQKAKSTLLYKHTSDSVWQVTRIQMGYQ